MTANMYRPKFKVTVLPRPYGMATKLPYSRDWRFDRRWNCRYCEVIPLASKQGGTPDQFALAPTGDTQPRDTVPAEWTVSGNSSYLRTVESGNGVRWWNFSDGTAYAAGTTGNSAATTTVATNNSPNWSLHLCKQTPPASQGIPSAISVSQHCEYYDGSAWQTGHLTLYIPNGDAQITDPILHITYGEPGTGGILTFGRVWGVLDTKDKDKPAEDRQDWTFEYLPHPTATKGGWIVISCNGVTWDAYHDDRVRLVNSALAVTVQGAQYSWNLSGIVYGAYTEGGSTVPGRAWPQYYLPPPTCAGSQWETTPTWTGVASAVTGWTATVEGTRGNAWLPYTGWVWRSDVNGPLVTFTRTDSSAHHVRPIAWFCSERYDATFDLADSTPSTTLGANLCEDVQVHRNAEWRNGKGSAEFQPAGTPSFTTWREGDVANLYVGWQDGDYGETLLASHFIAPGGLPTVAEGIKHSGYPTLSLQTEDLSAFLARNQIVDCGQAGGQHFGDWFRWAGVMNGLPSTAVYVDSTLEDLVIPYAPLPCDESLPAKPGTAWEAHIVEVCRAVGCVWGCDGVFGGTRYPMFAVPSRARYVHGTSAIAFTIDGNNTGTNHVERIAAEGTREAGPTGFRIEYGPQDARLTAYAIESTKTRAQGAGRVQWRNVSLPQEGSAQALAQMYYDYWGGRKFRISWTSLLRPDVAPEEFVQITVATYRGIAINSVFQIDDATYEGRNRHSTFTGTLVYVPGNVALPIGSGATGSGGFTG